MQVSVTMAKGAAFKKAVKKFDIRFYAQTVGGLWVTKHNQKRWEAYEKKKERYEKVRRHIQGRIRESNRRDGAKKMRRE